MLAEFLKDKGMLEAEVGGSPLHFRPANCLKKQNRMKEAENTFGKGDVKWIQSER